MQNQPFKLDPEKLAGHGLEEIPPWPPEAILEGESKHRCCVFFRGDIVVEVYEAVPAKFQIVAPYDEFIHILEGATGRLTSGASGSTTAVDSG